MAKAKHQKPKPRKPAKQTHSKKRGGKQNDVSELREQLDALGLKIIQVTADGNCFFRALADQLEGDEDQHDKYRGMVVGFIKDNREMFEPFVEDEVPFEEYCHSMGEDGTWAGHMELQAACLVTRSNICIHRNMSPRWYIQNFDKHEALMIHLSYHDGEHYNSVRSKEDTCSGPARPIVIKGDADLSAKSNQPKAAARKSREECRRNALSEDSIKMVKAGSGCEDARKVEQTPNRNSKMRYHKPDMSSFVSTSDGVLQQVGGDVDVAIEVLVAEEGSSDHIVVEAESYPIIETFNGNGFPDKHQAENKDQQRLLVQDTTIELDLSGNDAETNNTKDPQPDEKKISRNKACPCGSKKKYKSCCGTVSGRSSARFPVNQTVDYGKSRKDRRQGRKGGTILSSPVHSDGGPPDMGALCI
ncbi:OVARIAN TUMOR DOMAIN-containing deubiquitinating enzyme 7 isoform X3 [Salvia miltiorrhiza]|uniref:OVARIAN TUMOR DOMAIN-containing deubiquitinating enzyme 7 isoform X3 n=1 Tax=Salvia miltiorrhiza TaxID=226208 RepID=UPI0025ABF66F|nr:OVARIAN TUMOR DOMAIN-containing deubiquitinating enzyme 7 isoform X3 [Salvia miltiorrhiza]